MKKFLVTICNFTNVYQFQPLFQDILNKEMKWIDLSEIQGTDCYCDDDASKEINKKIEIEKCNYPNGIHFIDNGNYHYMTKIWTDYIREPFNLIVFDHHPDMQEPKFGDILSCGGWIKKIIKNNPFVQKIFIFGVSEKLVNELEKENYTLKNEITDKVNFITKEKLDFQTKIFNKNIYNITDEVNTSNFPIYISIDKDVLSKDYAQTNWDQGNMSLETLLNIIKKIDPQKIIGVDICGERGPCFTENFTNFADLLNSNTNQSILSYFKSI